MAKLPQKKPFCNGYDMEHAPNVIIIAMTVNVPVTGIRSLILRFTVPSPSQVQDIYIIYLSVKFAKKFGGYIHAFFLHPPP